jgi:RNA polymerase sigma factor (sigma-70 family)
LLGNAMLPETPLHLFLRKLRLRAGCSESPLSDAQLVERFAAARDEAAFELLVWRHGAMVFGLCRRLLRQEQDAEDAFQATFLTLARKAGSIRKREAIASWLYKVAYRIALAVRTQTAARAAPEHPRLDELPAAATADPGWRELRPVLDEEVHRLPEKYRAAFVLCAIEGKTNDEAAELLGCPKGTVLSRLSRARERLRGRLTRRGVAVSALVCGTVFVEETAVTPMTAAMVNRTVKAGLAVAAGQTIKSAASPSVAALTEGAIRAMLLSKLQHVATLVLAAGLLVASAAGAWALATGPRAETDDQTAAQSAAASSIKDGDDALQAARERLQTRKNLRNIVIALMNYADQNGGKLPPPALVDTNGKPLLSWRVLILPYVEGEKLYEEFHRDEPWDSEHNKKLLAKMPAVFAAPGARDRDKGMTYYQGLVGPGAAFEEGKQLRFPADFPDGVSNTIGVIEARTPVPWSKPEDVKLDPTKAVPIPDRDFYAAMMDSSPHLISKDADDTELKKVITRAGGEVWQGNLVLAEDVVPKDLKLKVEELARQNERLRKALAKAQEESHQTLDELNRLRTKAGVNDQIAADNAKLRHKLDELLDQMEQVREEIARLKKQNKSR